MKAIILLGAPGAGKGTQSAILVEKYNIPHIATGDMFRSEIASESELGLKVKSVLDAGELVDDQLVMEMVNKRLDSPDCAEGFLLDGFPRTRNQAEQLDIILTKQFSTKARVVLLEVSEEELISRIHNRAKTSGRQDDSEQIVTKRLHIYRKETQPLIEHYERLGQLTRISGIGELAVVSQKLMSIVESSAI